MPQSREPEQLHGGSSDKLSAAAHAVLMAVRRQCSLNKVFVGLAEAAKRYGVARLNVADELADMLEGQRPGDADRQQQVRIAHTAWAALSPRVPRR